MKAVISFVLFFCVALSAFAQNTITHVVKQGEDISSIAKQYNITIGELLKVNEGNADVLFPGLILNIPQKTQATQPTVPDKQPESQSTDDYVELVDGSYLQCKVISIKSGWLSFEQAEVEDKPLRISMKEVVMIKYKSGVTKRFKR